MHPTKELLIKLRNQIRYQYSRSGLCGDILIMQTENIICHAEGQALRAYVLRHRPKRGKHFDHNYKDSSWFWCSYQLAPRIAWLNDQIANFHENRI